MRARSGPSMFAQSDEPLNHIPYPLLSLSASQDPTPRNPAATLRDFGRGSTANQTHNESSHTDNPITPTQQICRHRPLLPLILHKSNVLLTTTRMQTNPHRSTFSYQISPTSHTSKARTPQSFHQPSASPCLHIASGNYTATQQDAGAAEGNQQPAKQLQHTRENNTKTNIFECSAQISKNFLIRSAPDSTFRPLRAWLPAQAFPCTVTGSMSPKS